MDDFCTRAELDAARERIHGSIHRTPLLSSKLLEERVLAVGAGEGSLHLKAENLQKTGSFKVRGALNHLATMPSEARELGVVTISAGNHAQVLAWAARTAGVACTVVMPDSAPESKVRASRAYGADVVLHGSVFEAFEHALGIARERKLSFVHPFDDDAVIAGQGTVALEIHDELPDVRTVVVPVGGGGLLAGIAAALQRVAPSARVYGVEPEGAPVMRRSLDAGRPLRLEHIETIADGLAAPMAGEITFRYARELVEDIVLVSDDEIRRAMTLLATRTKLLVEPAGAAAVAALLAGRVPLHGPTVALLSGGNVDPERLGELLLKET